MHQSIGDVQAETESFADASQRASDLVETIEQARDGTLWITTYGDGMVTFRNGVKTASYTRRQGLSSDLCRTLRPQDSIVWVGTDKGLNKIDLRKIPLAG